MIGAEGMAYYSPAYYAYTVFVRHEILRDQGVPSGHGPRHNEDILGPGHADGQRAFPPRPVAETQGSGRTTRDQGGR